MVDRGWLNRACLRAVHVLAAGLIVAFATDVHAGSGDVSCFGLYSQSRAVPGTRGCAISVAGGTPGGMGNYSCINRLDLIDSYCATPSTPPPEASCPVADPVYPATGVTTVSETDFVSGGDLPLVFKRTYRSAPFTRTDSGFGTNWFHNWQRQLDVAKSSGASAQVIAYRDDGSKLTFVKDAVQWKASGGMPFTLAQSATEWTVTGSDERYAGNVFGGWRAENHPHASMVAMPGKIRAFVYDAGGNPTGVSELTTDDPTGARGFDASTAGGQTRTYGMTYDSFNHLKTLQVYANGVLSEDWYLTTDASGNSRNWREAVSGRAVVIYIRDAAHRPLNLSDQGVDVTVGYDVRGRVSKFWYVELATQANGFVQRQLSVSYGYSPDGRVVSRPGSVKTDNGADVAISSDEIDFWLDNYEAGVMPAGPVGRSISSLLMALGVLPEPGLEPVCVECLLSRPVSWAANAAKALDWARSVVGRRGSECTTTQAVIDELAAAANEMHTAGQLISKAGRGALPAKVGSLTRDPTA